MDVNDIRILRAGGTFRDLSPHRRLEPRLDLFSPQAQKQAVSLKWQALWCSKGILTSLQDDERRLLEVGSHHPKEPVTKIPVQHKGDGILRLEDLPLGAVR